MRRGGTVLLCPVARRAVCRSIRPGFAKVSAVEEAPPSTRFFEARLSASPHAPRASRQASVARQLPLDGACDSGCGYVGRNRRGSRGGGERPTLAGRALPPC